MHGWVRRPGKVTPRKVARAPREAIGGGGQAACPAGAVRRDFARKDKAGEKGGGGLHPPPQEAEENEPPKEPPAPQPAVGTMPPAPTPPHPPERGEGGGAVEGPERRAGQRLDQRWQPRALGRRRNVERVGGSNDAQ